MMKEAEAVNMWQQAEDLLRLPVGVGSGASLQVERL
jgi:hypothetical protein